jgi:hypothetical protein
MVHLRRHINRRLICPCEGKRQTLPISCLSIKASGADCKETHESPISLLRHMKLKHTDDSYYLPSTEPFAPEMPKALPELPEYMPAYLHEPYRIRPARISAQRHAHLGPWVSVGP